jgi:hypothetical protein
LGRERLTRQNYLLGAPHADRTRQVLRARRARHDAERHLGQREARRRHRVDEVAGQRDLHAAGVGGTVDRGDDRNRTIHDGPDHLLDDGVLAAPDGIAHALALLEVGAGAKPRAPSPISTQAARSLDVKPENVRSSSIMRVFMAFSASGRLMVMTPTLSSPIVTFRVS